jgi:2-(1,2-epoxy-1,2-dihydrophenyl)acetyl-CoA isomerase
MNDSDPVLLEREGGLAFLTFNRPQQLNAIDVAMATQLRDHARALAADETLRCVVLRGRGRAFMAGGDRAVFNAAPTTETAHSIIVPLHEGLRLLTTLPVPVIGSLQGAVAGGGFSVALVPDIAIAADDLAMTLAYASIGASLDGSSSYFLPRLLGLRKAMELAFLSPKLDAAEALRLGLVNRVVPLASLEAETLALAERLAAGPTHAYARCKRLLRQSFDNDLSAQLEAELQAFARGTETHDFREGIAAFLAKRKPAFTGR